MKRQTNSEIFSWSLRLIIVFEDKVLALFDSKIRYKIQQFPSSMLILGQTFMYSRFAVRYSKTKLLVCRIGDLWRTWMITNWLKMSPGSILYYSESSEVSYPQTSNWSGTFFDVSYNKPAPTLNPFLGNYLDNQYCHNNHQIQYTSFYPSKSTPVQIFYCRWH